MNKSEKMGPFLLGITLFSMFFGSGNVVFPLVVGKLAVEDVVFSIWGFLATAVLMPLLGVIAMVLYNGSYIRFFQRLGKTPGFIVMLIILTVWIPLGSAPRCIAVAFGSLQYYMPTLPIWVFSLISCILIYFLSKNRGQVISVLGRYLTPALLISLGVIIVFGIFDLGIEGKSAMSANEAFKLGLFEGYNTMDLIASFFFSSTIIQFIRQSETGSEKMGKKEITLVVKACLIGASLLGVVYIGFMLIAASHSQILEKIPPQMILPELAMVIIGEKMRVISTLVVSLSCLTTVIALIYVYGEFLHRLILPENVDTKYANILTIVVTFILSVFDFEGISAFINPILGFCYPPLIILVIVNIVWEIWDRRKLSQL